jgi:hypothetical protein
MEKWNKRGNMYESMLTLHCQPRSFNSSHAAAIRVPYDRECIQVYCHFTSLPSWALQEYQLLRH